MKARWLIGLVGFTCSWLVASDAGARTWHIKPDGTGDAPTIVDAVFAASSGDTILLAPGTYSGLGNFGIDTLGLSLTFTSETGPESTIIDCQGLGPGFWIADGSAVISGITVENGKDWEGNPGAGIRGARVITNCIVRNNHSDSRGGGIYCWAPATVSKNVVVNNTAQVGGGIYFEGNVVVTENTVIGNTAEMAGGGICGESSAGFVATVSRNTVKGNSSMYEAGGIAAGGYVVFTENVVCDNTAWAGAGILCQSRATLTNNVIYGNCAQTRGGGILCDGPQAKILGNTVCENSAPQGAGIAFERDGDYAQVERTIIAFNTQGPGVECFDGTTPGWFFCCDIFGNEGGNAICPCEQRDNFSLDPQFCGILGTGNYQLQSDSPCAPGNHPAGANCELIGARPVLCGEVKAERKTWGNVKSLYKKND
jgi:hypothetical protein